jgi:serine/threonine protein kinase/Flp pilus assembly protein TadD
MTTRKCPSDALLGGFLRGRLEEPEADSVEQHIELCTSCQQALEVLSANSDSLLDKLREDFGASSYAAEMGLRNALRAICDMPAAPANAAVRIDPKADTDNQFAAIDATSDDFLGAGSCTATVFHLALPARYVPVREIARGGMGAIWEVRDTAFDRPLALKVMLPNVARDEHAVARFDREAEFTGRLQHPGIPPVVDRGIQPDGTPFFSMKLILGDTLDALLSARRSPADDLPRFISIFEQVCQAVGYAQANRVIHRDLKPANVMVGAFGEVQVMDWGMAKQLGEPEPEFNPEASTISFIELTRNVSTNTASAGEAISLTRGGEVLGTLAYMPPEQGRGERDRVDLRADVFSLGGLLLKILTGLPPFSGRKREQLFEFVLAGDLSDAFTRLDQCDADAELIALCTSCLAPDPDRRPSDASAVANAVARYQDTVSERLQQERAERIAAETRAVEGDKRARVERSKRRATIIAAAFGLLILLGATTAGVWYQQDQANRRVEIATREARETAERSARQSRARDDIIAALNKVPELRKTHQFDAAAALLTQAESRLSEVSEIGTLAADVRQTRKDLEIVRELDRLRLAKTELFRGRPNLTFANGPEGAFAKAFRKYGLDILSGDPVHLGRQIARSDIAADLIAGLDNWRQDDFEPRSRWEQLRRIAIEAVDNPDRKRLRSAMRWNANPDDILRELSRVKIRELSPAIVCLIAWELQRKNRIVEAVSLFKESLISHPDDFYLHYYQALGPNTAALGPFGLPYHIRLSHCRASLAIRPKSPEVWNTLAWLLHLTRRTPEAEQACRQAMRLDKLDKWPHALMGRILLDAGRYQEAEIACREAIKLDPRLVSTHYTLGQVLEHLRRFTDAEEIYRRAIAIDPHNFDSYWRLYRSFMNRHDQPAALHVLQDAVKANPKSPVAHHSLATVLAYRNRTAEAEKEFREAIKLDDKYAVAYTDLGRMLMRTTLRFDDAVRLLEQGHKLGMLRKTWRYPTKGLIAAALSMRNINDELQRIAGGAEPPKNAYRLLVLAEFAFVRRRDLRLATDLYERAQNASKRPLRIGYSSRYNAGCAYLLAARGGVGTKATVPNAAESARLRRQALHWLNSAVAGSLRSPSMIRDRFLRHWLSDPDLAAVRGESINLLPANEGDGWRKLWTEVDSIIRSQPVAAHRP